MRFQHLIPLILSLQALHGVQSALTCNETAECWQCISSGCAFNHESNQCSDLEQTPEESLVSKNHNQSHSMNMTECSNYPAYIDTLAECERNHTGLGECADDGLFACSSQNCTDYFACLIEAERIHEGEPCRFENDVVDYCNVNRLLIRCMFGNSVDSSCMGQCSAVESPSFNASHSCEECLYSTGISLGSNCSENCLVCDSAPLNQDSCYVCSADTRLLVTNSDCTGICVSQSNTTESKACSFSCIGMCTGLTDGPIANTTDTDTDTDTDMDTEPDDTDDNNECELCLERNGAQFNEACFQGNAEFGGCSVCGFGSGNLSAPDNCIACSGDMVLDVRNETQCTGVCVPPDQVQAPLFLANCASNGNFACHNECLAGTDDADSLTPAEAECARCLFRARASLNASECNADSADTPCLSCGYGQASLNSGSQCILCADGFELDVVNDDCTGKCVPENSATNPLLRALGVDGTGSCNHPCRNQCINDDILDINADDAIKCFKCLDSNGFAFGQGSSCFEGEKPAPQFDSAQFESHEEFCQQFNSSRGGCTVCRRDPLRSPEACLVCDEGFELDVRDYFTSTGVCVPEGCAVVPLTAHTTRNPCIRGCLATFEEEEHRKGYDHVCTPAHTDIRELCTFTVEGSQCPMQTPSRECCVALAAFETTSCSKSMALAGNVSDACPFFAHTTTQILQAKCGKVELKRRLAWIVLLDQVSPSQVQSDSGRAALVRAISSITGIPLSQLRVRQIRRAEAKQSGTEVEVEILGDVGQLANVEGSLSGNDTLLNSFNAEAQVAGAEFNETAPVASSVTLKSLSESTAVSSTEEFVELCELRYPDSTDCSGTQQKTCYSTNGLVCEAVLESARGDAYDVTCQGNFTGFGSCCETGQDSPRSFQATCSAPLSASTNNRVCTRLYTDDNCGDEIGGELCADFPIACSILRRIQESDYLDICGNFTNFGDCCTTQNGRSALITCTEDSTGSSPALSVLLALVAPLLVGFLLSRH